MSGRIPPEKTLFKIGEVSRIVGVEPHTLRYWESQFPVLRPRRTRSGHRLYRRADVEQALLIKRLLHKEGYGIAGARRVLATGEDGPSPASLAREIARLEAECHRLYEVLEYLKKEIGSLARQAGEHDERKDTVGA